LTERPNIDGDWWLIIRHRELAEGSPTYTVKGEKVTLSDGSAGTCRFEPKAVELSIQDAAGEFSHALRFDLAARDGTLSGRLADSGMPSDYHTDCYFVRAVSTEQ
jgi:hypothetical protein